MVRSKNFTREEVLGKSVPLFWKKGFAQTSVHDLEKATGVNKSGLYSEFANKEELYIASLSHYLDERGCREWLVKEPLGWDNIEEFLNQAEYQSRGLRGCMMVFAIREIPVLSRNAQEIIVRNYGYLRRRVLNNVQAERSGEKAERLTDMIMILFSGIALLRNLHRSEAQYTLSVCDFMQMLKRL